MPLPHFPGNIKAQNFSVEVGEYYRLSNNYIDLSIIGKCIEIPVKGVYRFEIQEGGHVKYECATLDSVHSITEEEKINYLKEIRNLKIESLDN